MIKINEAFGVALMNGSKVKKIELARKLWPDASPESQNINMINLCNGKTKTIRPEWVQIISSVLGVDANYLFNIKNNE